MITATTGNHGQSIALACQREGVPCTIVVPLGNNPDKNAAMRALGADVVEFGRDFDQARERVEELQRANGLRYVHSANEPLLIAGVATYALEIFEDDARRRRRARPDRRRQRRVRLRARALVARRARRRSSASRPPAPTRSRARGGAARA